MKFTQYNQSEGFYLTQANLDEIAKWCNGRVSVTNDRGTDRHMIEIDTPDGRQVAHPGDWIVRANGDYYRMGKNQAHAIFNANPKQKEQEVNRYWDNPLEKITWQEKAVLHSIVGLRKYLLPGLMTSEFTLVKRNKQNDSWEVKYPDEQRRETFSHVFYSIRNNLAAQAKVHYGQLNGLSDPQDQKQLDHEWDQCLETVQDVWISTSVLKCNVDDVSTLKPTQFDMVLLRNKFAIEQMISPGLYLNDLRFVRQDQSTKNWHAEIIGNEEKYSTILTPRAALAMCKASAIARAKEIFDKRNQHIAPRMTWDHADPASQQLMIGQALRDIKELSQQIETQENLHAGKPRTRTKMKA